MIETQRLINAGSLDADRVIGVVMERVRSATNADGAAVERAECDVTVSTSVSGLARGSEGRRAETKHSLSGASMRKGTPLLCRNAEKDARVDLEASGLVGVGSIAVAPIVLRGQALGVLKIMATAPDHFESSDVDVLELMANLIAPTLASPASFGHDPSDTLKDRLTGLANKTILLDRLTQQIYEARRYGRSFGLFFIDLDNFSAVNEVLGREGGDAVLQAVGRGLNGTVRSGDTLARLEGDQFVILCGNAERSIVEERLKGRIESVLRSVSEKLGVQDLAASVGVAWSSGNETSAENLLTGAGVAASRAKRQRHAGTSR